MLVLSRKNQEAIVINGEITVRIIAINGNTVRLGFEAPKEIPIHRSDILVRTQQKVAQPCAA